MDGSRDAVIVAYGRSPLARANKGSFAHMHPVDYGAQTLIGVLNKLLGMDISLIEDVIVGCAMPEKYCGYNIARLIVQRTGLPDSVPGYTINRFCSSGLQAIASAANAIMAGQNDIVVAGGIEMMTGLSINHPDEFRDTWLKEKRPEAYISMGETAENVAEQYTVSRKDMDMMAVESHRKAAQAQIKKKFDEEIIPITVKTEDGICTVTKDEGVRAGTSAETIAELKPCFRENGAVTAATSSQMTDGASFLVLMSREKANELGITPIAAFRSFAVSGVPADIMGIGPIEAVPKALQKAGLTTDQLDVIELNEAFASQALVCIQELNLPIEKVNPNGGAMALGHPLGATGAVLACKAIAEMKRTGGRYGLVTMCVGGGMGAAGILEMEHLYQ